MTTKQDSELQEWVDRLAVQDAIHRYSDAVTRADYEQMAAVFAPDAVWESPMLGLRFETAEEFIGFQRNGRSSLKLLIQTPHSPVIDLLDARRARATTTIHEMILGATAAPGPYGEAGAQINVDQYGMYHDDLEKTDGVWRFTHRLFVPVLIGTDRVVGDVVSERPLLRPE